MGPILHLNPSPSFDTFLDIPFLLLELFFKFKLISKVEQIYNVYYKIYLEILKDEFKILTGRTFSRNKMARK